MIPLPSEIMMKVTALQWQSLDQIKKEYADILGDAQKCVRADVLRSVVAYRLQEQFYKKSVPDSLSDEGRVLHRRARRRTQECNRYEKRGDEIVRVWSQIDKLIAIPYWSEQHRFLGIE